MIEKFIAEWFPKTEKWQNIGVFILESGIKLTDETNPKWLTGYTNIGKSYKPHHEDEYIRYMEENMFMLHDVVHQIFTLDTQCSEEEYVKRQIYGELFTFYLTEYVIPKETNYWGYHQQYINKRGCYNLLKFLDERVEGENLLDYLYKVFIEEPSENLTRELTFRLLWDTYEKYSKMFKEDLENSRKNYTFVPNVPSYCMVGYTTQNHVDFLVAVYKGAIKNIKREFNLKLPEEWI
jgi:hypothetical protein